MTLKGITSGLIDTVATAIAGTSAATEAESVKDGFLSHVGENHSAIIGFGAGLALGQTGLAIIVATALGLSGFGKISNRKAFREVKNEPWYAIGSAVLGFAINHIWLGSTFIGGLI